LSGNVTPGIYRSGRRRGGGSGWGRRRGRRRLIYLRRGRELDFRTLTAVAAAGFAGFIAVTDPISALRVHITTATIFGAGFAVFPKGSLAAAAGAELFFAAAAVAGTGGTAFFVAYFADLIAAMWAQATVLGAVITRLSSITHVIAALCLAGTAILRAAGTAFSCLAGSISTGGCRGAIAGAVGWSLRSLALFITANIRASLAGGP
jgi:hypothetical protein